MSTRLLLPPLLLLLTAAALPVPGVRDPHIQTVLHDDDQVVQLVGALGWQITVEFAPDERIETVSIGDALAWQVTPNKRARNLFLKPLIKNAATNMTVMTDRRRYVFALEAGARRATTPWVVRFEYPRPVVVAIEELPLPPQPRLNFAYNSKGAPALLPNRVWDNGTVTFFEFPEAVPVPAIFAGGPGKTESLVNSATRGRVTVVQQTAPRFTLRSGKAVATVSVAATPPL
ncbi:P-type conjugative transfer protein VirB9 [Polymorphobacter multimanifer]|uniref:Type IV secretion system protein VirB9 n=1 Tax=Polymorphobacter multimanifer TaxID=1070431 RepID=A0A841LC26_9SPHN|nr:TrbG/VirB9 family P-type conjugative transfer protein [Polymorphobacter multimanifer]MBB6229251.1 type IV secretion system protein VirB9 [Polymorphobacter multimanifer]GGI85117.1 P-type conjugative transfer protein VirB9 [Polymorphobacter multimanifer]